MTSLSICFIGAMFAMLFVSYMNFLIVFCKWAHCNLFIAAMFAMVFNSVLTFGNLISSALWLQCLTHPCTNFCWVFLWFPICSWFILSEIFARVLDSLMYWLLVFFKISLCSCFEAAKFQRVLDSLMHWLLVFFRTFFSNYFIAAMFARVFDFFMSFLWCFASDQFSYFIFHI